MNKDLRHANGHVWTITVLSRDGQTLIAHHRADDRRETVSLCTIERSKSLSTQIWINPPADGQCYSWD